MNTAALNVSPEATANPYRVPSRRRRLLGGILVREGLINKVQLEKALRLQETIEPHQFLGQILVDRKLITQPELNFVLGKYHKEHCLGAVLIETRVITKDQLEIALAYQRKNDLRLGEVLMRLNLITERQLKDALCTQLGITFVDLDDCSIDPGLSNLISERYARHHRVLPIARTDGRITLAMDDPTDLDVLDELRSSTGCRIEVVASTHAAMDRVFSRVYGEPQGPRSERRQEPREAHERPRGEDEEGARALAERAAHEPVREEREASLQAQEEFGALSGKGGGTAMADIRFGDLRASVEAVRRIATDWEAFVDTVEALAREHEERRAGFERLERELREVRSAHEHLRRELETKVQALTQLQTAHEASLQREEAYARSLGELREQCEALRQDRELVMDELGGVLRRFKP